MKWQFLQQQKMFLWSVSFLQNQCFTKAYENFSFASAVGPLISGIYISRTLKNRPGRSSMLHSIIMHVENAQAHGGAFICFWLLCMNLKRKSSKMCLLYSQSRICNYFYLWYNMLHHILKVEAYGRRSICFCNFGICNFGLLPFYLRKVFLFCVFDNKWHI